MYIHVVVKYTLAVSVMCMFAVIIYMYIVCACVELMCIIADVGHKRLDHLLLYKLKLFLLVRSIDTML